MSLTKPVRLRGLAVVDVDDAIRYHLQGAEPDVALGLIDGLEQAYPIWVANPAQVHRATGKN